MSFFKDLFYKVRVLLDGDAPSEDESRDTRGSRSIDEAMNEEYQASESNWAFDDDENYEESPSSLAQRMADEYIDEDGREQEEYFDEQPEPSYQRGYRDYDEDEQYFVPRNEQPAREEPKPEENPLPSRTEVTLREIARLSQKLDDATLEEYKRRIVMTKQQTGAVSALTALRILHEYVEDDAVFDSNGDGLPDLSAK